MSVLRSEKDDFLTLVFCVLFIPLAWLLYVDGFQNLLLGDDIFMALPRFADWLRQGGDWTRFLYRADILGGVIVADVLGKNLSYPLSATLGLGAIGAENFAALTAQVCFSFLGVKATQMLAGRFTLDAAAERTSICWWERAALVVMFAFLPVVCARFKVGHLDLLLGLLFFLVLVSYVLAIQTGEWTFSLLIVGTLSLALCIPSHGHQTKLYGLVFGFPMLLGLAWPKNWKSGLATLRNPVAWVAMGAFLSGCALALPKFVGLYFVATGSDASRTLTGSSLTYAFMTFQPLDLLASLSLHPRLIATGRPDLLLSDSAVALGPFLLFLIVLGMRRAWPLLLGLVLSLVTTIAFSMNLEPVSTALLALVGPLNSFRVPTRAFMPFLVMMPIVTAALLLSSSARAWSGKAVVLTVGCVLAILVLPPWATEVGLWVGAGTLVWWLSCQKPSFAFAKGALVVVMAVGVLAADRQWLKVFPPGQTMLPLLSSIGSQVVQQNPTLRSPMERVVLTGEHSVTMGQTALFMGLSGLTGYWNPLRRFRETLSGIIGLNFPADTMYFRIPATDPHFPVLQQLFNIRHEVLFQEKQLVVRPLPETLGPAWFVQEAAFIPRLSDLTQELNHNMARLRQEYLLRGQVVQDDPKAKNLDLSQTNSPDCSKAVVQSFTVGEDLQTFRIKVYAPALCTLVLATNYVEMFEASSDTQKALQVFPIFGTLTGVFVPAGSQEVIVRAVPYLPLWSEVAFGMGWLLLLVVASYWAYSLRKQRLVAVELTSKKRKKR